MFLKILLIFDGKVETLIQEMFVLLISFVWIIWYAYSYFDYSIAKNTEYDKQGNYYQCIVHISSEVHFIMYIALTVFIWKVHFGCNFVFLLGIIKFRQSAWFYCCLY